MTDNNGFIFCAIAILCLMLFGGALGVNISGGIETTTVSTQAPGILGALGWVWDSIAFFFAMIFFQVPGMPEWLSMIFLLMTLFMVYLLVKLIRGTGGG